jgi:hypothetical protein
MGEKDWKKGWKLKKGLENRCGKALSVHRYYSRSCYVTNILLNSCCTKEEITLSKISKQTAANMERYGCSAPAVGTAQWG